MPLINVSKKAHYTHTQTTAILAVVTSAIHTLENLGPAVVEFTKSLGFCSTVHLDRDTVKACIETIDELADHMIVTAAKLRILSTELKERL